MRNSYFKEEEPKFLIHDNDGKFGQFGRPVVVEKDGKKYTVLVEQNTMAHTYISHEDGKAYTDLP